MSSKLDLHDLTKENIEKIARLEAASEVERTLGERITDRFAAFIGSWAFIITQSSLLFLWMTLNLVGWVHHWDPFPFILLNLTLTFQAAFAGPILMMSQRRQSRMIERRNHLNLQISILAEQENTELLRLIRKLCEHSAISINPESNIEILEKNIDPDVLLRQIEEMEKLRKL